MNSKAPRPVLCPNSVGRKNYFLIAVRCQKSQASKVHTSKVNLVHMQASISGARPQGIFRIKSKNAELVTLKKKKKQSKYLTKRIFNQYLAARLKDIEVTTPLNVCFLLQVTISDFSSKL